MGAILAIAGKDLRLLARDRMGLFWALLFPLLISLFFGLVAGGGGGRGRMRLAVDDQDGTDASRALVAQLEASDALAVTRAPREAARAAVRRGDQTAYVVIPAGWGAAGLRGVDGAPPPTLEVGADPARKAEAGLLQGLLTQAVYRALAAEDTAASQALMPLMTPRLTLAGVEPDGAQPASAFEVTFPSGMLWGIIGCIATFAVSLVTERTRGTLARLRVAPISNAHILAGKALACFAACLGVIVLLTALSHLVFGVRIQSPGALVAAALCTAVCFVGLMMLLSTLGTTERAVAGAAWGAMMPLSMIGGGMIPLIAMPAWMQTLSHASPVRWGIVALEGAIWRGYGPGDMLLPCAVLLGVGAAGFTAGTLVFRARSAT